MVILERLLLVASMLALGACLFWSVWTPSDTPPALVVDKPIVQATNVSPDSEAMGEFNLTANQPIEILSISTSCSCAVASLRKRNLDSGQNTTLSLKWTIPESVDETRKVAAHACIMYRVLNVPAENDAIENLVLELNARLDAVDSK